MMNAYTSFAEVYDEFMDNVPYGEWANRFERLILQHLGGRRPDLIIDLGCGTGTITRLLAGKGYDVWGIDMSEDMLAAAQQHENAGGGGSIFYIQQDMRELDLPREADAVISACDCVNYLLTEEDLMQMFSGVYRCLLPGGLFIFDFNTVHKYRDVIGDTTIAENRKRAAFIWENWFDPETNINEYDLTLFMPADSGSAAGDADNSYEAGGGTFIRQMETHLQRGYEPEEMLECARAAGFILLTATDADDDGEVCTDSERILVALRRPE